MKIDLNFSKNGGFKFAPKRWSKVLFQEKHVFIGENMFLILKGVNKKLFSTKNVEKAYFDQRLECTAPKRWLKHATHAQFCFQTE